MYFYLFLATNRCYAQKFNFSVLQAPCGSEKLHFWIKHSFFNRNFKNGPKHDPKMAQKRSKTQTMKLRRPDLVFAGCWDPQTGFTKASWDGLGASLALLGPVLGQPGAPKKPKEPPQMVPGPPKGSPKLPDWTIFCVKRDNKQSKKTCGFIVFLGRPAT